MGWGKTRLQPWRIPNLSWYSVLHCLCGCVSWVGFAGNLYPSCGFSRLSQYTNGEAFHDKHERALERNIWGANSLRIVSIRLLFGYETNITLPGTGTGTKWFPIAEKLLHFRGVYMHVSVGEDFLYAHRNWKYYAPVGCLSREKKLCNSGFLKPSNGSKEIGWDWISIGAGKRSPRSWRTSHTSTCAQGWKILNCTAYTISLSHLVLT